VYQLNNSGMLRVDSKTNEQIAGMFNNIAGTYDFLNHFLSLNSDKYWRKKAISLFGSDAPEAILDLASGTGDFALAALKLNPGCITGIDISSEMLAVAVKKIEKLGFQDKITFIKACAEELPFDNETFTGVISAFGIRNFSDLDKGLREAFRVLEPGGAVLLLEFSKPKSFLLGKLYQFYFRNVLPLAGGWISGDRRAYSYLPQSVSVFPEGEEFLVYLRNAGFSQCKSDTLSGGIATVYRGTKSLPG